MRNLKRALSLTLASVMLLGMMVVGSSALSFNDADGISNVTAATVLEHLGVMQGDGQGNFMPEQSVTRAQMAILICRILYGDKLNVKQFEGVTKYTDVAANDYYTGYINLATQLGIIGGYGDGRFGPDDTVTTAQAALMLSRALGYFKANELEGQDWALAAIAQATKIDMFGDLKLATNELLARDNVSEMVFNTMTKAVPVMYSERWGVYYTDSQSIVEGVKFNYRNSLAYQNFDLVYNEGQTDDFERPATEWGIGTIKSGENGIDDKGHIAKNGANIKTSIIKAVNAADETYTAAVKLGDIYKDLGLSDAVNSAKVKFYRNGKDEDTTSGGKILANDGTDLSALGLAKGLDTKIGGNGVLTQVWYDTDAEKDETKAVITMIDTYVAEVANVVKATGSADRYIRLRDTSAIGANGSVVNYASEVENKFETEAFEADDLVTFTVAWNGAKYDIQTVESLALANTAVLTKWEGSSVVNSDKGTASANFTAGSTYKYSANKMIVDEDGRDLISNKGIGIANFTIDESEVNIYLDKYGYAIYVSGVEGETNYAAVIGIGGVNQYGSETRGATLLLPDGTQIEVKAKMANGYSWDSMTVDGNKKNLVTDGLADIVTYTVGKDGVYKLTIAGESRKIANNGNGKDYIYTGTYDSSAKDLTNDATTFINGKSLMQVFTKFADTTKNNGIWGTAAAQKDYYTTSKTIFFVATPKTDSSGYNYNVYTGYNNAPSIDKGATGDDNYINGVAFVLNKQYPNQIDAVYIDADQMAGVSGVDTYFVFNPAEHNILTNNNGKYYILPAIVDGEEKEIYIDAETNADWDQNGTVNSAVNPGNLTPGGVETLEYASKGVYAIENVVEEKGIITSCSVVNTKTFTAANGDTVKNVDGVNTLGRGTVKASSEVLGIGKINQPATYWAYDGETNVYYVDKKYTSISVSSIGSVQTDEDDYVFAGHTGSGDNKKLTDVIIVEFEPGVTYSVAASKNVTFATTKDGAYKTTLTGLSKNDVVYVKIGAGYVLDTDKSTVALTADGKLYKFTVNSNVEADAIAVVKNSSSSLDSRVTVQIKVGDEVIDATTVKVLTDEDIGSSKPHNGKAVGDVYFEFPTSEDWTLNCGSGGDNITGTMTVGSDEYVATAAKSIDKVTGRNVYGGYLLVSGNDGLAAIGGGTVAEVVLNGAVKEYKVKVVYPTNDGNFVTIKGSGNTTDTLAVSGGGAAVELKFRNADYADYASATVNVTLSGTDKDTEKKDVAVASVSATGEMDLGDIVTGAKATGPVTIKVNSVTPTAMKVKVAVAAGLNYKANGAADPATASLSSAAALTSFAIDAKEGTLVDGTKAKISFTISGAKDISSSTVFTTDKADVTVTGNKYTVTAANAMNDVPDLQAASGDAPVVITVTKVEITSVKAKFTEAIANPQTANDKIKAGVANTNTALDKDTAADVAVTKGKFTVKLTVSNAAGDGAAHADTLTLSQGATGEYEITDTKQDITFEVTASDTETYNFKLTGTKS